LDKTRFYRISRGSCYELINQSLASQVLGYGLFSNRLKGELLPLTRKAISQNEPKKIIHPSWRKHTKNREKKDPLVYEIK